MLRHTPRLTLLLAMSLLAAGCQPRPAASLSDADQQAVRQAEKAADEAIRTKDWPGWAASFTDNGALLPPNGAAVDGKAAIQTWAEAFPPFSDFETNVVTVDGRGDLAYVRGTYSMNISIPGAASPMADRGKYISIWQKQTDGSWKAVNDIFNSDVPQPEMAAASK